MTGGGVSHHDHDVVVVGSGFGGSVAALRLAEKGYDVLVYEAGRRFADHELPRTSWDLRRYVWAPALGMFGIQRIHRLPDVLVLAGAGVGGGSLNYANTLYVPPEPFFRDRQWAHITDWRAELAPHYDQASRMLGVVTNPCEGPVERVMREAADDLGVGETFRKTPVGVLFGDAEQGPGREVDDPYFGGAGPRRTTCTECGSCMTGCRVGAKNTLVKNYLALAERLGVRIEPMRTVVDVVPVDPTGGEDGSDAAGYRVTTRGTGPLGRFSRRTVTARHVVLAAGAWGTQSLLHDLRRRRRLPRLSERVGHLTRTNSEALLGALVPRVPADGDLSRGVAITSSFHPDADTHVENCRYGKGSNAMGLLATLLVDGGPGGPRWLKFLRYAARHPGELGIAASVRALEPAHRHRPGDAVARQLARRLRARPAAGRRHPAGLAPGPRRAEPELDPRRARGDPRARRPAGRGHRSGGVRGRHRRRPVRRADDRPLPRRLRDLGRARRRRGRPVPPPARPPRHQRGRRLGRERQPRREPVADHHRPGRAGVLVVAQRR